MKHYIWEGIYDSFAQVPHIGDGYSTPGWVKRAEDRIRKLQEAGSSSGKIPSTVQNKDNLLPFLTALIAQKTNPIRILDFGGGLGWTYLAVRDAQETSVQLHYDIVEKEPICHAGKKVWSTEKNLRFLSSLPDETYKTDIVHVGSTMQYIDDWQQTLRRLVAYSPHYILFTDLPAGSIPSFVSGQIYYESILPYRFYNIDEFCQVMESLGCRLAFRSRYISTILNKEQVYPQENFPKKYRLGDSCNLLFRPI